jgi:hypothetical protein
MAVNPNPDVWRPIEAFAGGQGMRIEEVRSRIESGALNGALLQSRWYVISSMIDLKIPDPARPHRAFLGIHAAVENGVLSAGYGHHELRLKYDREEIQTAIGKLTAPKPQDSMSPIDINLGGKTIRLDRSLHGEVLGVLFEWQIQVEHRDTLKQYQPELDSGET